MLNGKIVKKSREYINKNETEIKFLALFLLIIILALCMYKADLSSKVLRNITHISNRDEEQFVHDFTSGMEIRQKFSCYEDFEFITINFADHDARQQGKLGIQIIDANSEESIIYEEINMDNIYYTVPVKISFSDVGGGKAEKVYEVILRSADTLETAVGLFGYLGAEETSILNGEKNEYALSIGVHSNTNIYSILTKVIFALATLAVILIIFGVFRFHLGEQNVFLLLAIPFVICMLLMWSGNSVYDEPRHYNTVYNYSNTLLGYGKSESSTELYMRKCDVIDTRVGDSLVGSVNAQAHNMGYQVSKMFEVAEDTNLVLTDVSNAPIVQNGTVIEYLPSTIGMSVGRILGFNYYWMNIMTRIGNVVCYLLLCYYAICKIPVLKNMLVLLCALPMNLYQVSGISYDGTTFAIGIVCFAYIIKLWVSGLSKKEWIIFAFVAYALGSCKGGVYLTLLLLVCLIPKGKFQTKKWIKVFAIIFIGGISMLSSFVPTFMRWFGLGENSSPIVNGSETIGGNLHLAYMFHEPVEFMKMFILTMIENADMYFGQMLGYRTAWANDVISEVVMLPFLILMMLAVLKTQEGDFEINTIARIGILMILAIEVIGMHAIFLVETSVYSDIIVGCQGRYFILFIPCILLLFRNNGIIFKEKREYLYPLFSMAQFVYLYFFLEMFMCA